LDKEAKPVVIDAQNLILGRLSTFVAKQAILGKTLAIVNCEEAVISGSKDHIMARYKTKMMRGQPFQGPLFFRAPDRFVRRTIRGMIPWQGPRGKEMFGRIKCYIGTPVEFQNEKHLKIEGANADKLPNYRFTKVKDVCTQMGWKP
jgi:large subunit ribosomal protein L13